jgi:hypothetical protein
MSSTAAHRHQVELFVSGRRGWRVAEPKPGEFYGWRVVEVLDVAYHLRLRRNPDRPLIRNGWTSSYESSAGRLGNGFNGTYDHAVAEITRVENCLDVINELGRCRTESAARELMGPLKPEQVRFMCDVIGLSRVGHVGDLTRHILQRLCGAAVSQWRLTRV